MSVAMIEKLAAIFMRKAGPIEELKQQMKNVDPSSAQRDAELAGQLANLQENLSRPVSNEPPAGRPSMQKDSHLILERALYARYGNPPMKFINALSDVAYEAKGDVSLTIETTSGQPVIKFESASNPQAAQELATKFTADVQKLLASLQRQHPDIPANEWSFFGRDFIGIR